MPNVRRFFPGGKQLGKSLRPQESSSEEEEEEEHEPVVRHQVMASRTGGKYLRPTEDDDEEEEEEDSDDDDVEDVSPPAPIVAANPRGGGKSLSNMRPPDSEEEDSSEEEEEEQPIVHKIYRPQGGKQLRGAASRGGGKQLRMPEPPAPKPVAPPAGGKQLRREPEEEIPPTTTIARFPGGGKQLRPVEEPPAQQPIMRSPGGGKQLRAPEPVPQQQQPIMRSPGGGKQLRAPEPVQEQQPIMRSPGGGKQLRAPEPVQEQQPIMRSPGGGKQLRLPEPEKTAVEKPKTTTVVKSPAGGKQLQRPGGKQLNRSGGGKQLNRSGGGKQLRRAELSDDDDDDEEESEPSEDSDDDEDFVVEEKPKPRPKRTTRRVVKEESDDEAMFDDDASDDEEDKAYLASLPEIEREKILAERYEKKKEKEDMIKAMQATKSQKATAASPKKRKTAGKDSKKKKLKTDGDEELAKTLDGRRSSARSRDVSGTKGRQMKALAELKRQRKIQQDVVEESSDGSEIDFNDEEDSDEDFEEAKPWQSSRGKKKVASDAEESDMDVDMKEEEDDDKNAAGALQAQLPDFQKVTIPRRRLERWCNEPYFKDAVLNFYVRMFIGEDDYGEKQYRLCEIVDVKTGKKTYKFPRADSKTTPVSTDKTIVVRFGASQREFQMYLVSDAIPTESDVQKYISSQKNHRLEVISKRRAAQLRRMQDELVGNYTYTTADIERNLKERKKKGKIFGNLGSEQTRVNIAVQAAKDTLVEAEGRLVLAKRVLLEASDVTTEQQNEVDEWTKKTETAKKQLEELLAEQKILNDVLSDRKKKLARRTKDRDWAKVNQRAVIQNQQADREGYRVQKEADARKAAGEKEKFNPYARRKVKPKILWEVGQEPEEKEGNTAEASTGQPTSVELSTQDVVSPAMIVEALTPLTVNNDFTIDEEGLANSTAETLGLAKKPNRNRVRKGISLEEYLERKENGTL